MAARSLILLFDGTWSRPESDTNVERLRRLIAPRDGDGMPQLVCYLPGVGVAPGISHWLGGLFGYGFSADVLEGYRWLCDNWQAGDRIYIFGYSRGAYGARSIGGMIDTCGLLARQDGAPVTAAAVAAAYACYRHAPVGPDDPLACAFRQGRCAVVDIHFIGVWETVGRLGIPDTAAWVPFSRARYELRDTRLGRCVRHAAQALAIDEYRAAFTPTLWTGINPGAGAAADVEQRWFIGAHADVGGGYRADGAGCAPDPLPVLPLAWVQHKAMSCGLACDGLALPAADAWTGVPHDSYRQFLLGLYRWFSRPAVRALGTSIRETVDASVWRRWQADPFYRPPSLIDALAAGRIALPPAEGSMPAC